MGLTKEERLLYTLEALVEFERGLDHPDVCRWYDKERLQPDIDAIIEHITQMTGWVIQKANKHTEYMTANKGNGSLHDLKLSFFHKHSMSVYDLLFELNQRQAESQEPNMTTFAHQAGFNQDGLRNLAYWWDLWEYVGTLLSFINRYRDNLFEADFHRMLNRLIFSMMRMRRNMEIDANEEDVLLFKYFVYLHEPSQNKEAIDRVVKLTQDELYEEINDLHLKAIQDKQKYTRRPKPKVNPIVGDTETAEDQVRRIDREVTKQAGRPPHRRSTLMALIKDKDETQATQRLLELVGRENQNHASRLCRKCYLDLAVDTPHDMCSDCLSGEGKE